MGKGDPYCAQPASVPPQTLLLQIPAQIQDHRFTQVPSCKLTTLQQPPPARDLEVRSKHQWDLQQHKSSLSSPGAAAGGGAAVSSVVGAFLCEIPVGEQQLT